MAERQFAYTGPHLERGLVGYVNITYLDGKVRFTVRPEGEDNSPTVSLEVPKGEAVKFLAEAFYGDPNNDGMGGGGL